MNSNLTNKFNIDPCLEVYFSIPIENKQGIESSKFQAWWRGNVLCDCAPTGEVGEEGLPCSQADRP